MASRGSFLTILAALALAAPRADADGPYASVSESATWQDNVTNAPSGDGIRSAFALESGAAVTWLRSLDFSTILTLGADADAHVCPSYGGLDSLSVGASAEASRRLGLGPLAPVLYAGVVAHATGFNDPERSNLEGDLVLGLSKRLRDDLQVVLDGRAGSYDARDIVFCGNFASLGGTLNWDLDETWRIKLAGGWRSGDTVADYAAVKSPYGWVAIDPDTEYLPGAWHYVRTFNDPFVAYRESARTWSYGAGISPALGNHTSLALQVMHFDAEGYDRYEDNVVSLSLRHHF
jgi:hypothetical protein